MSVFALCDFEGEVQLSDKTRFDCSKSFNSRGSTAISTLTVKPGSDGSAISIYDSDSSLWYLDWVFTSFGIDVDSGNNSVLFEENGTAKSGTVATATYASVATYATAVAAAMTSAGTQTYTASVAAGKITISAPTTSFQFVDSAVVQQCFFDTDDAGLSITSDYVEHGMRIITVTAGDGSTTNVQKCYQKVLTVDGDRLFCSDTDLVAHEPDILKWVSAGRNSHKNVYRRARVLMLGWLEEQGYCNVFGEAYNKFDIVDIDGVRSWATYKSLQLIFDGIKNQVDDVFGDKAKNYSQLAAIARSKVLLKLDTNKDGIVDATEGLHTSGGELFRR